VKKYGSFIVSAYVRDCSGNPSPIFHWGRLKPFGLAQDKLQARPLSF